MGTTRDIHTTCVFCGCGCGLIPHANDGQILKASQEVSHPVSKGRLCIKGRNDIKKDANYPDFLPA